MGFESTTKPELCCLNTILSLENNAAPINIANKSHVLDRLLSDDYRSAWEETNDPEAPGKAAPSLPSLNVGINKVRKYFKYEKPLCDTEVDTEVPNICEITEATEETTGYIAIDIDKVAVKSWKVELSEFDNLCEGPSERRADKLRRAAYAIRQNANAVIIQALYTLINKYANGDNGLTDVRNLNLITDKGDINPVAMAMVDREYRESLFSGDYVLCGGKGLGDYFSVKKYRLSPEGKVGVMSDIVEFPFIYDPIFDTIFQGLADDELSHAVAIPIGSMYIDTWNEYTGYKEISMPDFLQTTIEIDGLLYDYALSFDKCHTKYTEMLKLHYGIGAIPDAAYCNGNGLIRHWTVGCGSPGCIE